MADITKFKEETTHIVILFIGNNEKGKKEVELVPRSWLELSKNKWFCFYPNESDYKFLEQWVPENKEANKESCQQFEVKIIKEAHSHSQGIRRLTHSYVSEHVESSSQNESIFEREPEKMKNATMNSSEIPRKLAPESVREALKNIPDFQPSWQGTSKDEAMKKFSKKRPMTRSSSESSESPTKKAKADSVSESDISDSMTASPDTSMESPNKENVPSGSKPLRESRSRSSSLQDSSMDTPNKKNVHSGSKPRSTTTIPLRRSSRNSSSSQNTFMETPNEENVRFESKSRSSPTLPLRRSSRNSSSSQDTSIELSNRKKGSSGSKDVGRLKINERRGTSVNEPAPNSIKSKLASKRKVSDEAQIIIKTINTKLESLRRSILYDIHKNTEELKALIKAANDPEVEEAIQKREILPPLPTTNLEEFLSFEMQLSQIQQMTAALKSFILLNAKLLTTFKAVINSVLPLILTKGVQCQYSAFGRQTKGQKKANFSRTQTFLILKEIVLEKFPDVSVKDFNNYIGRWLSNAVDREGGKQLRMRRTAEEEN